MTPHARLLAAADFIRTALLDLSSGATLSARHVLLDRRDWAHGTELLERAAACVDQASAAVYGPTREQLARLEVSNDDARGELLALDTSLEVRQP